MKDNLYIIILHLDKNSKEIIIQFSILDLLQVLKVEWKLLTTTKLLCQMKTF